MEADRHSGEAIVKGSVQDFLTALHENHFHFPSMSTSACGASAIEVLLYLVAKHKNLAIRHIQYRNSGDSVYGDKYHVVGYHAFTVSNKTTQSDDVKVHMSSSDSVEASDDEFAFSLTQEEKQTLLQIARNTLRNQFLKVAIPLFDLSKLTYNLEEKCGAFVTLYAQGRLRGCIGHFGGDEMLYQIVEEMTISAAFRDPRFSPLLESELPDVTIEISVLTPLRKIKSIDEFQFGKQGIYMEKGGRSGTFLPQVALETGWTKEEFLGRCARDKAGIGWGGWRDANLFTYSTISIREGEI